MKVVLDTNIFVSGVFFGGAPGKILNAWTQRKFEIFITPSIFAEYAATLRSFGGKGADSLAAYWIAAIAEHAHHLLDPKIHPKLCRDPDDDKFLYCAASIKADFLVTGDMDLRILEDSQDFKIISPRSFLSLLH
jgi:uncharacterized protein